MIVTATALIAVAPARVPVAKRRSIEAMPGASCLFFLMRDCPVFPFDVSISDLQATARRGSGCEPASVRAQTTPKPEENKEPTSELSRAMNLVLRTNLRATQLLELANDLIRQSDVCLGNEGEDPISAGYLK